MAMRTRSSLYSPMYVRISWRPRGAVSITEMSRMPLRLICRVRGIGVAERLITSTWSLRLRSTSFWRTPKRCSSSTTTRPSSLGRTSVLSSRCVPTSTSTSPLPKAASVLRCSAPLRKRETMPTLTGRSA